MVFYRVDEEVRSRVEARIMEKFPHLEVRLSAAHLTADGIELRGLTLSEPGAPGPQPELVKLGEVFIACRTNVQELFSGEPVVTGVRLVRPQVQATRRPDGSYSLSKIFPLPKPECDPPPVTVEGGTVLIFDPLKNPSSTFSLRDIHLTIKPTGCSDDGETIFDVQGSLAGDQLQRVELSGTVQPSKRRWKMAGTVDGLEISPELRTALPEQVAAPLEPLAALRVQANLSFRASCDDPEVPVVFEVNGSLLNGRLDDPLLPYPVTDLKANLHCDNHGVSIRGLTARQGQAIWEISRFDLHGFDATSPFELMASGRQVRLDGGWADKLPESLANHFHNYDPAGDVDLDLSVNFDGERYVPDLRLTSRGNVSFSCAKFPYRLERARGSLTLHDKALEIRLTAFTGAQAVALNGHFVNPGPDFTGWIDIRGNDIPCDEKLFQALVKPKSRETLRSLNPLGSFHVHSVVGRNDMRQPVSQLTNITVQLSSLKYVKFPYELKDVKGQLELRDGQWRTVGSLVGTNGLGVVTLSGTITSTPDYDVLAMVINAKNATLGEELRAALPPSQKQLWDSLQPHGKIDLDGVSVGFDSRTKKLSVAFRAYPRDDATSIGTSIEPVAFPYRLRLRGGTIDYHDGHVTLNDIHAEHGSTLLRAAGVCDFVPGGGWQLKLTKFDVDRLRLHGEDHELEDALPESLKKAVAELHPRGAINLKGAVNFSKRTPESPLFCGWDVFLALHRVSLQSGPRLENIYGSLRLTGSSQGQTFSSRGELALDNVTYKNFQFTQVIGPLWLDKNNLILGDWSAEPPPANQPRRHVTANVLGGVVAGDARVQLGAVPQYFLAATISQADLGQFARENLAGHQKLEGKILANVNLRGNADPRNLFGSGNVHLSEADVYQLPVMVSLLKFLRAKSPSATAFTESDIQFDIRGEHIVLKQINLTGDAVNLTGFGDVKLDGQTNPIDLHFHTMVGKGNMPILSAMMSEASQQILQIHVGGTLDNPESRTEAFPGANQALQQLQTDPKQPSLLQRAGGLLSAPGGRR